MSKDEMPADLLTALVLLVARLGRRDTVTYRELDDMLPSRDISPDEIETALVFLAERGIDVVEDDDPLPPGR